MVHIKIIQDKRRPKQDGTFPLFIRVTEKRKSMYLYTGYSLLPAQWDKEASKVLNSHPNASRLNSSITKRYFEVQKAVIKLEDDERFSFNHLKEELGLGTVQKKTYTVHSFANELIAEMFKQKRTGNALVYQAAINALSNFKPTKHLYFIDIDLKFLEAYQSYLIAKEVKVNTISNYLRTLRAIYNKAIKSKLIDKKFYPFDDFMIRNEKTVKRAISKGDISNIEKINTDDSVSMQKAKDFFLLSFYLIGISFTDLAYLTKDNIIDGRVVYKRRKTGKLYSIRLFPKAIEIFNRYESKDRIRLLPILCDNIADDSVEAHRLIKQAIKTTNKYLDRLANLLTLKIKLTTYVARHAWATNAKRLGYSNEMIAEALGHDFGNRTTAIYLDVFEKEIIDEMHFNVIRSKSAL